MNMNYSRRFLAILVASLLGLMAIAPAASADETQVSIQSKGRQLQVQGQGEPANVTRQRALDIWHTNLVLDGHNASPNAQMQVQTLPGANQAFGIGNGDNLDQIHRHYVLP